MEESANIEFFVRGLFTASTGLPAELYPQMEESANIEFLYGGCLPLQPLSRTHRLHTPLNQANRAFNTRDTPPNKPRLVSFSISYDTRHFNAYFLRILILSIVPPK